MADWSRSKQLAELSVFHARARSNPESVSDEEFIENIDKACWPTNCRSYVVLTRAGTTAHITSGTRNMEGACRLNCSD